MFLKNKQILFLHPGKTGGTTVEHMLRRDLNITELNANINLNSEALKQKYMFGLYEGKYLQHLPLLPSLKFILDLHPRFDVESCYSFVTIRNPFPRLYSAYMYNGMEANIRFDEFVLNNLANMKKQADAAPTGSHFKSQHKYTHIKGSQFVDSICKLEEIDIELPRIFRDIGIHDLSMLHNNKPNPSKWCGHYSNIFSDEMVKIVESVYSEDLSLFDYKFERKEEYKSL